MSDVTVYLVGLISSNPETFKWRQRVSKQLGSGFKVINPVASRFDKDNLKENTGDEEAFYASALKSDKASRILVPKSHAFVHASDVIIANLGLDEERPMVGSIYELAWGWLYRKPIIAICDEKHLSSVYATHPFIRDTVTHWTASEEEAVDVVKLHFKGVA